MCDFFICLRSIRFLDNIFLVQSRNTYYETGDPARLPAQLAGDVDKGNEIVYCEEKNIFYLADLSSQCRTKISCIGKTILITKEGALSFVLFESPFTSV
jgi:hypothetical protein